MARDLGFWGAIDVVDENGRIIELGKVQRVEWRDCKTAEDTCAAYQARENERRDRVLAQMGQEEREANPQAVISRRVRVWPVEPQDLRVTTLKRKRDWGPDRRKRELAEMYARGEFHPTEEYLAEHPELVAAKVKAQAKLLTVEEPVAVAAKTAHVEHEIPPQAQRPDEQPKPAEKPARARRRRDPARIKPKAFTIMGRTLHPAGGYV